MNQEKILLEWQTTLQAEGQYVAIQYCPHINGAQLTLGPGRIDAYLGPNPGLVHQVEQGPAEEAVETSEVNPPGLPTTNA